MQEKLILRAVELEDMDLIYSFENDDKAWRDGTNTRFYSRYAIEQYVIATQNENVFSCQQMRLMIDIKTTNATITIGCVDLYDMDFQHFKASVGIYIDKKYRQLGYAKQSLNKLEKYACNTLNLHQLYAFIREDNAISQKLFLSCNYLYTAKLTDWVKDNGIFKNVNIYQKKID